MEYQRQTARKCRISHLLSGKYVQKEGWEPNYVETELGQISRVNIMAIVVGKEEGSLTLDDGSSKISLRSFGQIPLQDFEVGDMLLVIGRPRKYNEEIYLAAEIVKKIDNGKWLEYRKMEISQLPAVPVTDEPAVVEHEPKPAVELSRGDKVLQRIRELDKGEGADIDSVVKDIENGENIVNTLLEEGDVFEIKPGKIKVLE